MHPEQSGPLKLSILGPRYDNDASEFVPQAFTTTDKFALPQVLVDGGNGLSPSYNIPPDVQQHQCEPQGRQIDL